MKMRDCPFCGNDNLYMDNMESEDFEYHFVVCGDCWAEGPMCATSPPDYADPGELAKAAWNGDIIYADGVAGRIKMPSACGA